MTVQESFDELMGLCFGPTLPPNQYKELRRAFFAGAFFALQTTWNQGARTDDRSGRKALKVLADLHEECKDFARMLNRGER